MRGSIVFWMAKCTTLLLLTMAVLSCAGQEQNAEDVQDVGQTSLLKREKRELLRRSKRRWVLTTIEVTEQDEGPFPKHAATLFNDQEVNYQLKYVISGRGVTEHPIGIFSVNETDGRVFVHKPIDREIYPEFHVKFDVLDRATNRVVDRTLAFDVEVKDVNDNAPEFTIPVQNITVKETTNEGDLQLNIEANDIDLHGSPNSEFNFKMISQTPSYPAFSIRRITGTNKAIISFKGCFDYEKEKQYRILVEAKDKGEPTLSSTATININIEDGNNHPPVFTKQKYEAEVHEGDVNVVILRMAVKDEDNPNTPASNAVFKILSGNDNGNFQIETNKTTNEGILSVIKAKDYEEASLKNLVIAVENEEPLFTCPGTASHRNLYGPQTVNVSVAVKNINDAPVFQGLKPVYVSEAAKPGTVLTTLVAKDDETHLSKMRYELVSDPANWVAVNEQTGQITNIKEMDRESPFVNNSIYAIVVHAIDDGDPPATTTATVLIHLSDVNDNKPYLITKNVHICGDLDQNSVTVTAGDKDIEPYAGPFAYELLDKGQDVKTKWKLDQTSGDSVDLRSLQRLPNGNYSVPLKIEDKQGQSAEENLYVQVCDCEGMNHCRPLKAKSSALGGAAIGILLSSLLLLLLLLCLCLLCSSGRETLKKIPIYGQDEGNQTLIKYNEEGGGSMSQTGQTIIMNVMGSNGATDGVKQATLPLHAQIRPWSGMRSDETDGTMYRNGINSGTLLHEIPTRSQSRQSLWNSRMNINEDGTLKYSRSNSMRLHGFDAAQNELQEHITRRLYQLRDIEDDVTQNLPHIYAYEGQDSRHQSLDRLSIANSSNSLNFLHNLGPRFNTLDRICHQTMQEKGMKL
ncbi:cadherin-like protein 26 [Lepisosteus oculatus]|uniref:cadherin-like protein 26 n=1 Tax=Lepisosteus oculatus TaxID=7918 RepID=UPI0035F5031A